MELLALFIQALQFITYRLHSGSVPAPISRCQARPDIAFDQKDFCKFAMAVKQPLHISLIGKLAQILKDALVPRFKVEARQ